jgi:hypothetical protein
MATLMNGHDHDRALVAVEDAVIVHEHAPGELALRPALQLDVDQHPCLAAIRPPDFDQGVGQAPAQIGVAALASAARPLLQLFVEQHVTALPVDRRMRLREEEGEGVRQVAGERLLPRAVVVGGWRRLIAHAG